MRDGLPIPDVPTVDPGVAAAHLVSIGAMIAAFVGWLPALLALIPAFYYVILIWESSTVQHYLRNRRMRRKAKRVAKLRAQAKVVQAQLDAEDIVRSARTEAREKVAHAAVEAKKQVHDETLAAEEKMPPI